jgi:hypothetical protein
MMGHFGHTSQWQERHTIYLFDEVQVCHHTICDYMITMIYLLLQSPPKIFQSPYSHSFTAFLERSTLRKLDYFLKLYHQRKCQNAAMYGFSAKPTKNTCNAAKLVL